MATATFICEPEDDGYVTGVDTVYPPSAPTGGDVTTEPIPVNRSFDGANYMITNATLRWNVSPLPDDSEITSAVLRIFIVSVQNADARSVTADWKVPAGDVSFNWTPDVYNDALSGVPLSDLVADTSMNFDLTGIENIGKYEFTGLRLHISGGEPTGLNEVVIGATLPTDGTPGFPPRARLIVTYDEKPTVEQTIRFVHSGLNWG